jgi:hypothetical protein
MKRGGKASLRRGASTWNPGSSFKILAYEREGCQDVAGEMEIWAGMRISLEL